VPNSYETLTDREKEVLRLLAGGHDAKSAACEMNLSVHAVNERLRSTRRKLGVTSSKQAVRILLEGEGTNCVGYKQFEFAPVTASLKVLRGISALTRSQLEA